MRCLERVQIGKSGRCESYCQLEAGHSGEHSIEARFNDIRCLAIKNNQRCSQPAGHFGSHTLVSGAVIISWE